MDEVYKAALERELASLRNSTDRPAKYRRIREIHEQLGTKPEGTDLPPTEYAVESAPRERAVPRGKGN